MSINITNDTRATALDKQTGCWSRVGVDIGESRGQDVSGYSECTGPRVGRVGDGNRSDQRSQPWHSLGFPFSPHRFLKAKNQAITSMNYDRSSILHVVVVV